MVALFKLIPILYAFIPKLVTIPVYGSILPSLIVDESRTSTVVLEAGSKLYEIKFFLTIPKFWHLVFSIKIREKRMKIK